MGIEGNYTYIRTGNDYNIGTDGTGGVQGPNSNQLANDAAMLRFEEMRSTVANEAGLPDIGDARLTNLEEMEAQLSSLSDKLSSTLSSVHGTKVMFDIYALMALVQELAQKMRNALREVRQFENQSIQMNLKNQAETQRYAATTAAIAGAVLCAAQGVVTIGMAAGSLKQMSTQSQVFEKNGVQVYDRQSQMAQAANDPKAANLQATKLSKSDPALWQETRMSNGDAAKMDVSAAKAKVSTAEQNLEQAQADSRAARTDLETTRKIATGELKENEQGVKYTVKDRAKAMEAIGSKEAAVKSADAKVAKMGEELETAKTDLATAKEAVATALQKDVDAYGAKYEAVRSRANVELEETGKISPETQADLKKAETQFEMARAKQVATVANMRANGDLPASAATDLKTAADLRYAQATQKAQTGVEATKSQREMVKMQAVQTISMTFGQYAQQLVSSLQQIISADAVELQADQKMMEDQLDQIKDLMQQQLSLIQKAFELFASVTSKESQTIEGIIRA